MSNRWIATILAGIVFTPHVAWGEEKPPAAAAKPAAPAKKAVPSREALEKEFAERLSGATLVGTFTIDGQDKPPQTERYSISSVRKLNGDVWLFVSRIQYGNHDLTVPMPLSVLWAGDTPIITLTELEIPGLGVFTSRVMIFGDRYAGTWQHGQVGGHLFGKIEKAKAP